MARESFLLGIDIGTYESKGVLTTIDGKIVCHSTRAHDLIIPQPGWAEHDAEQDWWGDFCFLVRNLLEKGQVNPRSILAVGCSTIGPCLLPVSSEGVPLRHAILYGIDTRAGEEIDQLKTSIGADQVFDRCGNDLSAQSVGPKIVWLKKHEPDVFSEADRFVSGTTYLVWKLTGRWVIDHYSASTFTPLYDMKMQSWSDDPGAEIVETRRLPEIAWTTALAGQVSQPASRETLLPEGIPVIVGTIDAAAEAVSVGVVQAGRMMLMFGSTTFMILPVDKPTTDPRLWSAPFLFPGTDAVMAGMATTGALTRWFRDNLARDLLRDELESGISAYEALAREAGEVPPCSKGLIILPYFSGERTPINDPDACGVVFGLNLSHTRAHLYRAVLESVGFGIRHHLEIFRDVQASVTSIQVVGGGVKNELWLEITSDICGVVLSVPRIAIGAAYGDAFLAGLGIGLYDSPAAISDWVEVTREIQPSDTSLAEYGRHYTLYRALYQSNRHLMKASP